MSTSPNKPASMNFEAVFHMKEGLGDTSYDKNSSVQRRNMEALKNLAAETATQAYVSSLRPGVFTMADLGCSTGGRALAMAEDIIRSIGRACGGGVSPVPEISVLLNDLPANDFNTAFLGLPEFTGRLKANGHAVFVSAVPGSFYGRLFPSRSVHFVSSFTSLHWLSQVPPGLVDESTNKPINKGKIFISSTSPPAVAAAYSGQFRRDFRAFLRSRAAEVVPGGRMVLSLSGRETDGAACNDRKNTVFWDILSDSLAHLVSRGLVEQGKVDALDVPYYAPSAREIEDAVLEDGSFRVDSLRTYRIDLSSGDAEQDGKVLAATARAVHAPLMSYHFGPEIIGPLFQKYAELIAETMKRDADREEAKWWVCLGVVLARLE